MKASTLLLPLSLATAIAAQEAAPLDAVTTPPKAEVERLTLDAFYQRYCSAGGVPIVASSKVSPYAMLEARHLIDHMLDGREDIRAKLVENKVRFAIMAATEMTTAIPEHATLKPGKYWDRRARGLGATKHRPCVSCGEENLLRYPGDPYFEESILLHEFAHAIHHMALVDLDETFDERLKQAYQAAMKASLWKGKYAASNRAEYWAEGAQSWFDDNREDDHDHNHVNTREELREYDPGLAALCEEVFGDRAWRYQKPQDRDPKDRAHLKGYDVERAPRFRWPEGLEEWYRDYMRKKRPRD